MQSTISKQYCPVTIIMVRILGTEGLMLCHQRGQVPWLSFIPIRPRVRVSSCRVMLPRPSRTLYQLLEGIYATCPSLLHVRVSLQFLLKILYYLVVCINTTHMYSVLSSTCLLIDIVSLDPGRSWISTQ